MPVRNYVTFKADLPDDSVEDDRGHITIPAGKSLATSLIEALQAAGHHCGRPEQHSFYGWAFEVREGSAQLWCLLQYPEPWLLMTELRDSFMRTVLAPNKDAQATVLRAIDAALKRDSRFSGIEWFSKDEYESVDRAEGHASPF